jgi:hypothetical protein
MSQLLWETGIHSQTQPFGKSFVIHRQSSTVISFNCLSVGLVYDVSRFACRSIVFSKKLRTNLPFPKLLPLLFTASVNRFNMVEDASSVK